MRSEPSDWIPNRKRNRQLSWFFFKGRGGGRPGGGRRRARIDLFSLWISSSSCSKLEATDEWTKQKAEGVHSPFNSETAWHREMYKNANVYLLPQLFCICQFFLQLFFFFLPSLSLSSSSSSSYCVCVRPVPPIKRNQRNGRMDCKNIHFFKGRRYPQVLNVYMYRRNVPTVTNQYVKSKAINNTVRSSIQIEAIGLFSSAEDLNDWAWTKLVNSSVD